MKTIRQALRQRARRILAALFARKCPHTPARSNAGVRVSDMPQVRRRRIEARPWPQGRGGRHHADGRHRHP